MNRCIGVDIGTTAIRLVQVSRRRGRLCVLGTHTRLLAPSELPVEADAIGALLSDVFQESGFKAGTSMVIALPHEQVFFHSLTTDLTAGEDIRRLLRFELEDDFPVPFDDLVVDVCGHCSTEEGRHEYLVAASARRHLSPWIQALAATGWKCSVLSTGICALQALARLTQPQEQDGVSVLLHADGGRMVLGLMQDGSLICARQRSCTGDAETLIPSFVRDIELTLRARPRSQRHLSAKILLSGPDALLEELSERLSQMTGREVLRMQLPPTVQECHALQFDGEFAVAVGLALLGLDPTDDQFNLLHADPDRLDRTAKSKTRRAALVSAILFVAILGLFGVKMLRELSGLQTEHARLDREIRRVFVEAFPGEKKIVNELAQMTEHLNSLQKQRDTLVNAAGEPIRPLWALQVLSERLASDEGIRISSFVVADRTIHISGTGDSFESVEQFLTKLHEVPQFESVKLEDMTSSRGSDRPGFRLMISVKAG